MKRLILFAGVPASGKTSKAKELIEQGFSKLCADDIRVELYEDAAIQGDNVEIYRIFDERLDSLLGEEQDIIVDNTNIMIEHRMSIINRARSAGYVDIEIWLFDVPLEVCLERNRLRHRVVRDDVIVEMHQNLFGAHRPQPTEAKVVQVK